MTHGEELASPVSYVRPIPWNIGNVAANEIYRIAAPRASCSRRETVSVDYQRVANSLVRRSRRLNDDKTVLYNELRIEELSSIL